MTVRPALLWLVAAATVAVLAVALGGAAPQPAAAGLPDPGPVVGWGLPLVRLAGHAATLVVVAVLLTALLSGRPARRRGIGPAVAGWVVASAGLFLLGLSEVVGRPPPDVLQADLLLFYARDVPQGRALVQSAALAVVVGGLAPLLSRRAKGAFVLLALTLLALVPPMLTGHAAGDGDHRLAQLGLVLHVLAAVVWVGGLAGVALLRSTTDLPDAAARFSSLALVCVVTVGLSGMLSAYLRLDDFEQLWRTGYGALLLGKCVAFVLLVAAGAWHRWRVLPALCDGGDGTRAFRRLAIGEVVVMAAAFGLAVALGRTPVG